MSADIANNLMQSIGISNRNDLNLNRLVHLALSSSPKVGIVNFNILKTFLLELLKALNIQNFEPKFNDDFDAKNLIEDALQTELQDNNSYLDTSESNNHKNNSVQNITILASDMKPPLTLERFHALEDKLARFEKQIAALNSLPSNQNIIDKSKDIKHGTSAGPVLEIWQYTQLSKRVESNEEGLTKMTSLLQDLINELNDLKENQNKNTFDLKSLTNQFNDLLSRFTQIEKFKDALTSLDKIQMLENEINQLKRDWLKIDKLDELLKMVSDRIKDIENKIIAAVSYSDLDSYATWPALDAALNGLKDQFNAASNSHKSETSQNYTQTVTPPPPNHDYHRPSSSGGFHPSKELQDLLSKLGTLDSRHETLKDEVDKLKIELDKKKTEPLHLPEDFAQKMEDIKQIKSTLEELIKDLNIETNKRLHCEKMINEINKELEMIKNSLKELMKNTKLNSNEIEALKEAIRLIEDSKADKSWIRSELDKKGDRKDLDDKVNKKLFDDTNSDLSHLLDNCVKKSSSLEAEWKKSSENLFKELESKLDRLELDSLKEYIEKQLKKLKKLQKDTHMHTSNMGFASEDDAAGLRKQLLKFHCISCDRPIEIGAHSGVVPSLPADRGIRPIQTPRPYTTFELDQIRQFQKQQTYPEQTNFDLFATYRQCGGSHTLTMPHKRIIKSVIPDNEETKSVVSSVPPIPTLTQKSEVQIQGQDGHIYKGRIEAKLNIEMKRPQTSRNALHNYGPHNQRASSAYPGIKLSSLNQRPNGDENFAQNHNNNDNDND